MAVRSVTCSGMCSAGGSGSPTYPQPARRTAANAHKAARIALQYVPAEILILHDIGELLPHVRCIDTDGLLPHVGRFERDLLQQLLHDRMQPPRADVLIYLVDVRR